MMTLRSLTFSSGCDALSADPLATFALSLDAYANCVQHVLSLQLPTLLLGGGGYVYDHADFLWVNNDAIILLMECLILVSLSVVFFFSVSVSYHEWMNGLLY